MLMPYGTNIEEVNIGWWYNIVAAIADRGLQTSDVSDVGYSKTADSMLLLMPTNVLATY
jgi:hypothetical protein